MSRRPAERLPDRHGQQALALSKVIGPAGGERLGAAGGCGRLERVLAKLEVRGTKGVADADFP